MNVFILEDHPMVSYGIQSVIESSFPDAHIKIQENLNDAISSIGFQQYDLVIVDLNIKGKRTFDFLEKSAKKNKSSKHLVFTSSIRRDYYEKAFECKADGYLVKECMPEDLIYAIKTVMKNRQYIDPIFYDVQEEKSLSSNVNTLSNREREILKLIGNGYSNKKVADELYISINTVKKHVTNIFSKMDFSNRNEAYFFCQNNYV